MSESNFGPELVVALGAQMFADVMSSTSSNLALQNIRNDADRNLSREECVKILAKNCIEYADAFAWEANKYLKDQGDT